MSKTKQAQQEAGNDALEQLMRERTIMLQAATRDELLNEASRLLEAVTADCPSAGPVGYNYNSGQYQIIIELKKKDYGNT